MNCPSCGQPVPERSERCPDCGHEIPVATAQPGQADPALIVCPGCGFQLAAPAAYCPNCGTALSRPAAWPPPPSGFRQIPPPVRSNSGDQVGGFSAGCVLTLFLGPLYGLGLLLAGIVYLFTRRKSPVFARWVGFGMAAGLALILGLLVICYPMIKSL